MEKVFTFLVVLELDSKHALKGLTKRGEFSAGAFLKSLKRGVRVARKDGRQRTAVPDRRSSRKRDREVCPEVIAVSLRKLQWIGRQKVAGGLRDDVSLFKTCGAILRSGDHDEGTEVRNEDCVVMVRVPGDLNGRRCGNRVINERLSLQNVRRGRTRGVLLTEDPVVG